MERYSTACDVCSQALQDTDVLNHILLHMSQISKLCNSLPAHSRTANELLQQYGPVVTDTSGHFDTITRVFSSDRDRPPTPSKKKFRCPACDHAPFSRRQEQIRHFARHYKLEKSCEGCSLTFHIASKFIWHRCQPDAVEQQKAYKRRWQTLRKDVGKALDRASRNDFGGDRAQPQQIRQRSGNNKHDPHDCSILEAAQDASLLPSQMSTLETEACPSSTTSQLVPATIFPQTRGTNLSIGQGGLGAGVPESQQAGDHLSTWFTAPSNAPIIWDNWNWPNARVSGNHDQTTLSR